MQLLFRKITLLSIVLFTSFYGNAQQEWKLKTDKDNIKVYTSPSPDSKVKALKVVCPIEARLTQLSAVLLDINATTEWVYKTKSATILKQISPSEIIYYSEIDMPWPLSNRDFIVRIKISQNPATKIVTMETENMPKFIPEKKDIVRIYHSEAKWILKPIGNNHVQIEYTLVVDPAGSIPTWLVNMFSTKGPFECFKNMKVQIAKPVYVKVKLPFIVD